MGGAFHVPGNTGPVAEFNYFVDPEAAEVVLSSGLRLMIVPLDVTQRCVLMRKEVERAASAQPSILISFIDRFTRMYMRYHLDREGFDGGYLHDPLAVAVAVDASLVRVESRVIVVETESALSRGMTIQLAQPWPVHDRTRGRRRSPTSVDVVTGVDRERFLKLFHDRVLS